MAATIKGWKQTLERVAFREGAERVVFEMTRGNHIRVRLWWAGRESRPLSCSLSPSDARAAQHRVRQDIKRVKRELDKETPCTTPN